METEEGPDNRPQTRGGRLGLRSHLPEYFGRRVAWGVNALGWAACAAGAAYVGEQYPGGWDGSPPNAAGLVGTLASLEMARLSVMRAIGRTPVPLLERVSDLAERLIRYIPEGRDRDGR